MMTSIQNINSVSGLYQYFKDHDKNGDGQIDLKTEAPEADQKFLNKADTDWFVGNGKVSIQEALKMMQSQVGLTDKSLDSVLEVESLLKKLNSSDDLEFIKKESEKLLDFKDFSAVPALVKALKNDLVDVRKNAAWALGAIGDYSAVPAIIETQRIRSRKLTQKIK
jgi:HEAT repeat protein